MKKTYLLLLLLMFSSLIFASDLDINNSLIKPNDYKTFFYSSQFRINTDLNLLLGSSDMKSNSVSVKLPFFNPVNSLLYDYNNEYYFDSSSIYSTNRSSTFGKKIAKFFIGASLGAVGGFLTGALLYNTETYPGSGEYPSDDETAKEYVGSSMIIGALIGGIALVIAW